MHTDCVYIVCVDKVCVENYATLSRFRMDVFKIGEMSEMLRNRTEYGNDERRIILYCSYYIIYIYATRIKRRQTKKKKRNTSISFKSFKTPET